MFFQQVRCQGPQTQVEIKLALRAPPQRPHPASSLGAPPTLQRTFWYRALRGRSPSLVRLVPRLRRRSNWWGSNRSGEVRGRLPGNGRQRGIGRGSGYPLFGRKVAAIVAEYDVVTLLPTGAAPRVVGIHRDTVGKEDATADLMVGARPSGLEPYSPGCVEEVS